MLANVEGVIAIELLAAAEGIGFPPAAALFRAARILPIGQSAPWCPSARSTEPSA
jgi:hypothetical protein